MNQKICIGVRNLTYRLGSRSQNVASFHTVDGQALPLASAERIEGALKLSRSFCTLFFGAALGLFAATAAPAQNTVPPELAGSTGKPPSGTATRLTPACRAAKQYIGLANEGRFQEIGDLFAKKVDYVGPDAVALSSQEDVMKGYVALEKEQMAKAGKPRPRVERLAPLNDNECFLEFSNFDYAAGVYRLFAIDHFIVGPDGKVIWFRPYFQESSRHWHDDSAAAAGR